MTRKEEKGNKLKKKIINERGEATTDTKNTKDYKKILWTIMSPKRQSLRNG